MQIFLQAGNGVLTGQGENPVLMLRWSDDGGETWGNTHYIETGRQGQYRVRAIIRRLGRSRNRVFEVSVSDPVPWQLVDAFMSYAVQKAVAA